MSDSPAPAARELIQDVDKEWSSIAGMDPLVDGISHCDGVPGRLAKQRRKVSVAADEAPAAAEWIGELAVAGHVSNMRSVEAVREVFG